MNQDCRKVMQCSAHRGVDDERILIGPDSNPQTLKDLMHVELLSVVDHTLETDSDHRQGCSRNAR